MTGIGRDQAPPKYQIPFNLVRFDWKSANT